MIRTITLFVAILTGISLNVRAADLHVSPAGSDANPGSPEKPLATLARAVQLSRTAKPARILLYTGRYHNTSVELTSADSGLTIEAAPGARPLLLGGIPLSGWAKDGDRFHAAPLPPGRATEPRVLIVNGRFCPRARFPESGVLSHESTFNVPWMSTTGGGWQRKPTNDELTTLKYNPGDIPPTLDTRSAEITVYHMWDESCVGVAAHDPATRTLRLSPACGHPPGAFGVKKYILWNIREGLTQPGQWHHDRAGNRIVYWPLPGEDMAAADALIPTQTTILRLAGTRNQPIANVTLRNLAFSVTTVPLISGGFGASAFDGAVSLSNARDCLLTGLSIRQVAGHAINATRDIASIRVENADIAECGAGGIYLGGVRSIITNNHVRGVGRLFPSAIGIFRGGRQCIVSHNEVHDCTYSAINYGGEENIVENNLIYDCMKVLHDGAAIYMFAAKKCILRGNFARDFKDLGGYGASAYYLDERSEDCIVENNLSVNVGWPCHNHMCKPNTIRNNVFVVFGDAELTFPRSSGFTLEGNVIYATGKIRIENIDAIATWRRNILYSAAGKVEGVSLKDYSATGTVNGIRGDTLAADPLFRDVNNGDYAYKPDSPALKLNLNPLKINAGRQRP